MRISRSFYERKPFFLSREFRLSNSVAISDSVTALMTDLGLSLFWRAKVRHFFFLTKCLLKKTADLLKGFCTFVPFCVILQRKCNNSDYYE